VLSEEKLVASSLNEGSLGVQSIEALYLIIDMLAVQWPATRHICHLKHICHQRNLFSYTYPLPRPHGAGEGSAHLARAGAAVLTPKSPKQARSHQGSCTRASPGSTRKIWPPRAITMTKFATAVLFRAQLKPYRHGALARRRRRGPSAPPSRPRGSRGAARSGRCYAGGVCCAALLAVLRTALASDHSPVSFRDMGQAPSEGAACSGCYRCHSPPLLAFIYTRADATPKNIYPILPLASPQLLPAIRHYHCLR
jgi:hypothetical protein